MIAGALPHCRGPACVVEPRGVLVGLWGRQVVRVTQGTQRFVHKMSNVLAKSFVKVGVPALLYYLSEKIGQENLELVRTPMHVALVLAALGSLYAMMCISRKIEALQDDRTVEVPLPQAAPKKKKKQKKKNAVKQGDAASEKVEEAAPEPAPAQEAAQAPALTESISIQEYDRRAWKLLTRNSLGGLAVVAAFHWGLGGGVGTLGVGLVTSLLSTLDNQLVKLHLFNAPDVGELTRPWEEERGVFVETKKQFDEIRTAGDEAGNEEKRLQKEEQQLQRDQERLARLKQRNANRRA